MTGAPALLGWRDVELGAPELAQLGMARLTSAHVALLGALGRDPHLRRGAGIPSGHSSRLS